MVSKTIGGKSSNQHKAGHATGECYGVSKSAEIIFKRGKMIKKKGEGLPERMKTIDPNDNETYKFLREEQSDVIKKGRDAKSEDRTNQRLGIVNQDRTE